MVKTKIKLLHEIKIFSDILMINIKTVFKQNS